MLTAEMSYDCKEAVMDKLVAMSPDTTAFDELPDLIAINSAPTGAKMIGVKR